MKKKRNRYSAGFKEQAIRRMQEGERVKALSLELQVSRGVLFEWRLEAERRPGGKTYARKEVVREGEDSAQEVRIQELEAALGRKTMELDFFQSALRRLAASGPQGSPVGEKSSGPKSATGWNRKAD